VRLDLLTGELDRLFSVERLTHDDWSTPFAHAYGDDSGWRAVLEPRFRERWGGLAVRGDDEVEQAVTCVFPTDELIESLEPRTLLFSEHPLAYSDRGGFAAVDFSALRTRACSFYAVHVPLYQHPELAPSLLLAHGLGLDGVETFFPLDPALAGGIAAIGSSDLGVDGLAHRLRSFLGPATPVHVLTRTSASADRVAVVAGSGARADVLEAALARGCRTYVTGNAATSSAVVRVQERVRAFRELADREHVTLVDATHYGSERAPQLAMAEWFRHRGLPARFAEADAGFG
jgi:putative NIF3 family GTP cyclohydrolase 1 type 2